jgi:homoserine acetyltransferase
MPLNDKGISDYSKSYLQSQGNKNPAQMQTWSSLWVVEAMMDVSISNLDKLIMSMEHCKLLPFCLFVDVANKPEVKNRLYRQWIKERLQLYIIL